MQVWLLLSSWYPSKQEHCAYVPTAVQMCRQPPLCVSQGSATVQKRHNFATRFSIHLFVFFIKIAVIFNQLSKFLTHNLNPYHLALKSSISELVSPFILY